MEIMVQVQDEQEAYLIKNGLQDERLKTFIKVCAALNLMPDETGDERKQVLQAVCYLFGVMHL